jgi:hypothetical protein
MKSFEIGVNRRLEINDDGDVIIKDTQTSAEALFPDKRWRFFLTCIADVDGEVQRLKEGKEQFRYKDHYGGGWYVSVTSGIRCVDLRRFFMTPDSEIKPTRHGIGLRLPEWETLKNVIEKVRPDMTDISSILGCFHPNQEDWIKCLECLPFYRDDGSC